MARIRIEDLPVKEEMSEQELKGVFGGAGNTRAFNPQPEPPKGFGLQRLGRVGSRTLVDAANGRIKGQIKGWINLPQFTSQRRG